MPRPLLLAALAALLLSAGVASAQQPREQWGPTTSPTVAIPLADAAGAPPPSTIAGSGSWTSGCSAMGGSRAFSVFWALSGAGTLQVQRYADRACAQPVGGALPSTALALTQGGGCPSSSYCGDVTVNDGRPYLALKVTVTDTSTSTNTVVGQALLAGAE